MITVAVLPSSRYYQDIIMTIIMSAEASTRWDGKMSGPKHMSQMEAFKSFLLEFWSGWWNLYVTTSKKEQWKTMENDGKRSTRIHIPTCKQTYTTPISISKKELIVQNLLFFWVTSFLRSVSLDENWTISSVKWVVFPGGSIETKVDFSKPTPSPSLADGWP
jgi:hypothetical protein